MTRFSDEYCFMSSFVLHLLLAVEVSLVTTLYIFSVLHPAYLLCIFGSIQCMKATTILFCGDGSVPFYIYQQWKSSCFSFASTTVATPAHVAFVMNLYFPLERVNAWMGLGMTFAPPPRQRPAALLHIFICITKQQNLACAKCLSTSLMFL